MLGKHAKMVIQTSVVLVDSIKAETFDLLSSDDKMATIHNIKEENKNLQGLKGMEMLCLG